MAFAHILDATLLMKAGPLVLTRRTDGKIQEKPLWEYCGNIVGYLYGKIVATADGSKPVPKTRATLYSKPMMTEKYDRLRVSRNFVAASQCEAKPLHFRGA